MVGLNGAGRGLRAPPSGEPRPNKLTQACPIRSDEVGGGPAAVAGPEGRL